METFLLDTTICNIIYQYNYDICNYMSINCITTYDCTDQVFDTFNS